MTLNAFGSWRIVGWIVFAKLVTLALLGLAVMRYPERFSFASYIEIYRGNHGVLPSAAPAADVMLRTWDAEHYLKLAEQGYGGPGPENAFYPLYPLLVRAFKPLCFGHALLAALLLSNLFGVVGLALLHRVLGARASPPSADAAIVLMCLQPAAFFTCLPYAEALFLCLVALAFYALDRGHFVRAGLATALLALTRPVGIFCAVPLAIGVLRKERSVRAFTVCLLPLLGTVTYFAIVAHDTGDPFTGFAIQQQFVTAPSLGRLLDPLGFLRSLLDVRALHGFASSLLDRAVFVAVLAGLFALIRRGGRERLDLVAYTALLGVVPAVTSHFMSYVRYASVLFPVFLVAAELLEPRSRRAWLIALGVALLALQLWLLDRHINYRWAA